nr:ribonuclease H-like domain-containing protein [Tanacetum cinerariifolium]
MSLYGSSDKEYEAPDNVTLISILDVSNPLHLHPNDSAALTVVSIKLKGTENYHVWSNAMLLALEGKNKTGFIDGSCKRSNVDEVLDFSKRAKHVWEELKETYDKVDGSFLMGLDDSYMNIRSSILSRDPLPNVRSAYATISSEESHRVVSSSMSSTSQRSQTTTFASNVPNRTNFQRGQTSNNNFRPNVVNNTGPRPNNSNVNRQTGGSGLVYENCGFNGHTVDRCFKLIGYPPDFGKKINDEQLSTLISLIKDNTLTWKNVHANMADNVHDISHLKIKVAHPNGTEAFISKIGNLRLPNGLTLFDVLVIPEYYVTLISVHKLAKDNKFFMAFDESRCYFLNQDLNLKNVLRIGNKCGGLYYFDYEDKVVYMKPPQGYYHADSNNVCILKKSLYGLKQAPSKSENDVLLTLHVYVDDIIVTGNNVSEIEKFKDFPRTKFMIKDLGKLKCFLGIEVINTDKGICLNQRKYVLDLLTNSGMLACQPARTPMMSKFSISNKATDVDPLLDNIIDYQKLMGKLIYLTNTRPDISYVVHCLSQFMHALLKSHLRSAFKILRYLKGSPGLGIHIIKEAGMFLKAYSDADWAKCIITRKSVTAIMFL